MELSIQNILLGILLLLLLGIYQISGLQTLLRILIRRTGDLNERLRKAGWKIDRDGPAEEDWSDDEER